MSNNELIDKIIKWANRYGVLHDEVWEMPHFTIELTKLEKYLTKLKTKE